ncbi:MAG: hypothetical protein Q4E22_05715 [Coriobacteriia bacterium]|nr:hypothetical protein [Coriobacteriia bacterium]
MGFIYAYVMEKSPRLKQLSVVVAIILLSASIIACSKQDANQANKATEELNLAQSIEQNRAQAEKNQQVFESEFADTKKRISELELEQARAQKILEKNESDATINEGFRAKEKDGIALMSQGRFTVSETDGQKLILEADPHKSRVGIYTNLGVNGDVTSEGSLRAKSLSALGNLSAQSIRTPHFSVDEEGHVLTRMLHADQASVSDLDASNISAGNLNASEARIDVLRVKKLEVEEKEKRIDMSDFLKQADLEHELNSYDKNLKSFIEAKLEEGMVLPDIMKLSALKSTYGEFDELQASSIRAQNIQSDLLEVQNFEALHNVSASSVDADQLHAKYIEAGIIDATLNDMSLDDKNYGQVVFKAPKQNEIGRIQRIALSTPPQTLAVFIAPSYQDTDNPAYVSVLKEGSSFSIICRYPSYEEGQHDIAVTWFALSS